MEPDAMILVFWMLSFKPTFSLSSFTFIKRIFSSSSLSYWLRKNCHPDFWDTKQVKNSRLDEHQKQIFNSICVDSSGLDSHIAVKAAHNMSIYQIS